MKVYNFISIVATRFEGTCVSVATFGSKEDALTALNEAKEKAFKRIKEIGCSVCFEQDGCADYIYTESETDFEVWEDGRYIESSESYRIEETELH